MRARSIPSELEPIALKWFLKGETYAAIADRLDKEHDVDTTAGSVHRTIDRIARGAGCDGVVRTVARLRADAPRLVEKLHQQLAIAEKMAGLDSPVEVPAGMTPKMLDFLNKITLRELKAAGCMGREAERTLELSREATEEHLGTDEEVFEEELLRTFETSAIPRVSTPPNVQDSVKQGRNEKCACGSGLKFKKCCGFGPVRAHAPVERQALAG